MFKTDPTILLSKSVPPSVFFLFIAVEWHTVPSVSQAKNHRIHPWLCFSLTLTIPTSPSPANRAEPQFPWVLYSACLLMKPTLVFALRHPHCIQLILLNSWLPTALSLSRQKLWDHISVLVHVRLVSCIVMHNLTFPSVYFISFDSVYYLTILVSFGIFIFSFIHAWSLRAWVL